MPIRPAAAQQPEPRHAVLRLNGDLDATHTLDQFVRALDRLDEQGPRLILIEFTGNRTRPDLLFEAVRAMQRTEAPTAVWLADTRDRRVGPGFLALALAAAHAGVHPATTISRDASDDLTALNPDIEDWAVLNLDLRAAARDLAEAAGKERIIYESVLAPRSALWITTDENGSPTISDDEPIRAATPLVEKNAEGWSFELPANQAPRLFGLGVYTTPRAFQRVLEIRGRPIETIEIDSELIESHKRALTLVRQLRVAVRLADAALDVRAGRPATTRIMPHEYHASAERARALVPACRDAIAEIAALTTDYPEILHMIAPPDADTPTEIGGPSRSTLASWRDAVRDAEYDLARIDERIETYQRR